MKQFVSGTRPIERRKIKYEIGRVVSASQIDLFKDASYHFTYKEDGREHQHPATFSSMANANRGMRDYVQFLNA